MAEQEKYQSRLASNANNPIWGSSQPQVDLDALNRSSGSAAEQDRFASYFSINPFKVRQAPVDTSGLGNISDLGPGTSGSEHDRLGSHISLSSNNPIDATAVGIFRSTLLPSVSFHSGLAVIVYAASRATNRVDGKDWLWPAGQVLNAWWSAVGTRVVAENISVGTAYSHLIYSEKLLLTGVTLWGARLFYRIASRSLTRKEDDARYHEAKKEEGFWNKALFTIFLPEALFQAVISLPFTLPFRALDHSAAASPLHVHPEYTHGLAIALFSAGFALEVIADFQLAAHQKAKKDDLNREGVWSIVRNPNSLGDALMHASFPILLSSAVIMHPLALLGPVANYFFLRFGGGDVDNETSQEEKYKTEDPKKYAQLQEYRQQKGSFWPKPEEIYNPWTWVVVSAGLSGFVLERVCRGYLHGWVE